MPLISTHEHPYRPTGLKCGRQDCLSATMTGLAAPRGLHVRPFGARRVASGFESDLSRVALGWLLLARRTGASEHAISYCCRTGASEHAITFCDSHRQHAAKRSHTAQKATHWHINTHLHTPTHITTYLHTPSRAHRYTLSHLHAHSSTAPPTHPPVRPTTRSHSAIHLTTHPHTYQLRCAACDKGSSV